MLERSDRAVLGKRARVAARDLTAVQRDGEDLTLIYANVDAAPDESGIQRVVAGIEAQIRIGRNPEHPAPIDVRRRGQRSHHRAFLDEAVDRARAQRLVHPRVRAIIKPAVQLQLAVQLVGEAAAGLEAAFHEVLQALDDALGLRVTRIAEVPVDAQLPAEGGELDRRSAARRVQAGLVACSTLTEIRKITRAILLGSPAPAPGVTGTVGVACVEADAATYGTLRPQEIAPGVLVRWTG